MDAKGVIDKILSEAQSQADTIKQEADKKTAVEKAEFDKQLAEYKKQTEVLAKKAGEEEKQHLLAATRMEIAKKLLAEKRKILDEVYERAQIQLRNMQDEEYCELMSKLMIEAVETGDEEVVIDNKETRIDQEFVKQVNRKLEPGYKGNLRFSGQKEDLGGGFVLRRGKIKNNVSLAVLLAQARKELEIRLAKELFANGA